MENSLNDLKYTLESIAYQNAVCLFGVADLDIAENKFPDLFSIIKRNDMKRAIVCGIRLQDAVIEEIIDQPTILYFHNYRQVNWQLDRVALLLADILQSKKYKAIAIPASQLIKHQPPRGHISHIALGWAAGLGFIGRSNLLINPKFGARVRYVSILTDAPLPYNLPIQGECGSCHLCQIMCPVKAINDTPEDFNFEACFSKLCQFSKLSFIGQHICGICVKACSGPVKIDTKNG